MYRKNLLNRSLKTFLLSVVTALTLTGCSFEISSLKDIKDTDIKKVIDYISDEIDETNINNNQEVTTLAEDITKAFENQNIQLEQAKLIRVVDGDTIVVEIDNEQKKVRLIGVDTPESVASQEYLNRTGKVNSIEGKNASEYTKEVLKNLEYVYLQKDKSDTDRYGRLLRFVWIEVPNDTTNKEEIATKMLNGILLNDHVANVASYKPDISLENVFKEIYDDGVELDR